MRYPLSSSKRLRSSFSRRREMVAGERGGDSVTIRAIASAASGPAEPERVLAHGGDALRVVEQSAKLMIEDGNLRAFDRRAGLEQNVGIALLLAADRIQNHHRKSARQALRRGHAARLAEQKSGRAQKIRHLPRVAQDAKTVALFRGQHLDFPFQFVVLAAGDDGLKLPVELQKPANHGGCGAQTKRPPGDEQSRLGRVQIVSSEHFAAIDRRREIPARQEYR